MTRQEAFERSYAESHDLPIETFSQYRMGDTYRLPGIASHWRTWCAALDSVEIRLTNAIHLNIAGELVEAYEISDLGRAFKAAGLKVAD